MKNNKGFSIVEGLLILVITGILGFTGWYVYNVHNKTTDSLTNANAANSSAISTQKTTSEKDTYEGWKAYKSNNEGFSLRYPPSWTLVRGTNGGQDDLSEVAQFKSKEGLIVRYTGLGKHSSDRGSCGTQALCGNQKVISVDTLNLANHGKVLLVKEEAQDGYCPSINLDEPSGSDTTPVVGDNAFKDHYIFYSLPRKEGGGRFALFLTDTEAGTTTFSCDDLTQDQFFNMPSVKQAELILRSIAY